MNHHKGYRWKHLRQRGSCCFMPEHLLRMRVRSIACKFALSSLRSVTEWVAGAGLGGSAGSFTPFSFNLCLLVGKARPDSTTRELMISPKKAPGVKTVSCALVSPKLKELTLWFDVTTLQVSQFPPSFQTQERFAEACHKNRC